MIGAAPKMAPVMPKKKKGFFRTLWGQKQLMLMSVPMLLYVLLFNYYPLWGWRYAFQDLDLSTIKEGAPWIGLGNFDWLFKEELNDIKKIKWDLQETEKAFKATEDRCKEIKETYDECLLCVTQAHKRLCEEIDAHHKSHTLLEDCRKFMNSICDIGTDVGFKSDDHSWAVICVHGKMDYVKFVDMSHRDVMEISHFLKRFEYSNRATDSPLYKNIIEDMIVKL